MEIQHTKVPLAFRTQAEQIMHGAENLNTIAKLKEFWLFGIEQGKSEDYETRAAIADIMFEVASLPYPNVTGYASQECKFVYLRLESYRIITTSKDEDAQEHKRIGDVGWSMLENDIRTIRTTR